MEVGVLNQGNTQQSYNSIGSSQSNPTEAGNKTADSVDVEQGSSADSATTKEKKPLTNKELGKLNVEMNKFLELINSDIKFVMHEKTHKLMVQVVDVRENKVLKEFPPHEMLDTLARISDYVGLLLDKKA